MALQLGLAWQRLLCAQCNASRLLATCFNAVHDMHASPCTEACSHWASPLLMCATAGGSLEMGGVGGGGEHDPLNVHEYAHLKPSTGYSSVPFSDGG